MGMSDRSSDDGGVRPNVSYILYITLSLLFYTDIAYLQASCDFNCKIAMISRYVFVGENMLKYLIHKMYKSISASSTRETLSYPSLYHFTR